MFGTFYNEILFSDDLLNGFVKVIWYSPTNVCASSRYVLAGIYLHDIKQVKAAMSASGQVIYRLGMNGCDYNYCRD